MPNSNLDPNNSPTDLLQKPSSKIGVKKLNKLPLFIVIGSATIVLLSLGYAMYQRGEINRMKNNQNDEKRDSSSGNADSVVASLLAQLKEQDKLKKEKIVKEKNITVPTLSKVEKSKDLGKPTDKEVDNRLKEEALRLKKLKERLFMDALRAPTKLKTITSLNSKTLSNSISPLSSVNIPNTRNLQMTKELINSLKNINPTPKSVVLKNELWMENAKRSYDYIKSRKSQPISKYEIKAGSIIPGILITGINSELPGQVLGQVSQNVYDTATGKYLLIPQGTKIVGLYNADVTYGQSRVMIAWNRLIFPDGQTLNIGSMYGTDQAGKSGFEDEVDHHYFRIFGSAFLMTLLNGDMSIKKDGIVIKSESSDKKETAMEKAAAKMVEKNMNIAPTIKIRPGYRFNIFVTKDIILEPLPYSVYSNNYNQTPKSNFYKSYIKPHQYNSPYYSDYSGRAYKNIKPATSNIAKVR